MWQSEKVALIFISVTIIWLLTLFLSEMRCYNQFVYMKVRLHLGSITSRCVGNEPTLHPLKKAALLGEDRESGGIELTLHSNVKRNKS